MAEYLKLQPTKSILKVKRSSVENAQPPAKNSAGDGHARFDEMNILATYHPPDKDYGHMKIEEPKTPFQLLSDGEEDLSSSSRKRNRRVSLVSAGVDPEELTKSIEQIGGHQDDPEAGAIPAESMSPEQLEHKKEFEKKRRAHYDEGAALLAAKCQTHQDEDENMDVD